MYGMILSRQMQKSRRNVCCPALVNQVPRGQEENQVLRGQGVNQAPKAALESKESLVPKESQGRKAPKGPLDQWAQEENQAPVDQKALLATLKTVCLHLF